MLQTVLFWFSLCILLVSWELVLIEPSFVLYWFGACLVAAALCALHVSAGARNWRSALVDRFAYVVFLAGIFWWLLWIDFSFFKYAIALLVWLAVAYFARAAKRHGSDLFGHSGSLAVYVGGTFFWATTAFGLVTVLGWSIWKALVIFTVAFALLSWTAAYRLADSALPQVRAWLVLVLIAVETFSLIVWLPFTEITLALMLTIVAAFAYDILKYLVDPSLIRRKIAAKKALVYFVFLALVLLSTPWY